MWLRVKTIALIGIGLAGCTVSPMTVNMVDSRGSGVTTTEVKYESSSSHQKPSETFIENPMSIDIPNYMEFPKEEKVESKPEVEVKVQTVYSLPPDTKLPKVIIPPLPTFTDEELNDIEVVERKLIEHIKELRSYLQAVEGEMSTLSRELNIN